QRRVASPVVNDARADFDSLGCRGVGCHRDNGVAHESRFCLPHCFEASRLRVTYVVDRFAKRMFVLEVEGNSAVRHIPTGPFSEIDCRIIQLVTDLSRTGVNMLPIRGVYEIAVRVKDLTKAEPFYREVLGLEVGVRDEERNWLFLRAGGDAGMVVLQEDNGEWPL